MPELWEHQRLQLSGRDVYTHGHHDSVLRSHRWRTAANSAAYLLAHLRPGMRLLDVGCGPGTLTADLARTVAPGSVTGIDVSETAIAEAAGHAATEGVTNLAFLTGDFRAADLEPGSFDVVHAHQVLQHLVDPVGALAAMGALAVSGGIVAARDSDYPAFFWWPADDALDRWLEVYLAVARHNGAEPAAGRRLRRWAAEAGLVDVAYTSSTWTFTTADELAWWGELWAERTVSSAFGEQAVNYGISTSDELNRLAAGWRRWACAGNGVFVVVHGEILGRRGAT